MELHTIFDAWNQQIIQLKSNKNGFSGIGLNELTLSMIDRNKKIQFQQIKPLIKQSKFKVMKMLSFQNQIMQQINQQIMGQPKNNSEIGSVVNLSIYLKFKKSAQKYFWVYQNQDYDEYLQYFEDSKWIFYSDEALSYGLELVYLIEEELFGEVAKQLRKKVLQLKMS